MASVLAMHGERMLVDAAAAETPWTIVSQIASRLTSIAQLFTRLGIVCSLTANYVLMLLFLAWQQSSFELESIDHAVWQTFGLEVTRHSVSTTAPIILRVVDAFDTVVHRTIGD